MDTTALASNGTAQPTSGEDRQDDWLPKTRTEQAFADRQTVGWMNDSGFWGVSYPISGDTLAALKDTEAKPRG